MCKRIFGRALWRGLLLALPFFWPSAQAQDFLPGPKDVEIGSGVQCDSGEQAERYVALFKGDANDTLMQVNAEAKSNACGVVPVAFLRGNTISKVANSTGTFTVTRVLVVGILTPQGVQDTPPFLQYALFRIDERIA